MAEFYTYVLRCADGTLYTGWTTDLPRRVRAHNDGRGAKYTAGRRPVQIAYAEAHESRSAAQRRESEIKRLPRMQKLALIAGSARRPAARGRRCG